jgi:hypothetical protein
MSSAVIAHRATGKFQQSRSNWFCPKIASRRPSAGKIPAQFRRRFVDPVIPLRSGRSGIGPYGCMPARRTGAQMPYNNPIDGEDGSNMFFLSKRW